MKIILHIIMSSMALCIVSGLYSQPKKTRQVQNISSVHVPYNVGYIPNTNHTITRSLKYNPKTYNVYHSLSYSTIHPASYFGATRRLNIQCNSYDKTKVYEELKALIDAAKLNNQNEIAINLKYIDLFRFSKIKQQSATSTNKTGELPIYNDEEEIHYEGVCDYNDYGTMAKIREVDDKIYLLEHEDPDNHKDEIKELKDHLSELYGEKYHNEFKNCFYSYTALDTGFLGERYDMYRLKLEHIADKYKEATGKKFKIEEILDVDLLVPVIAEGAAFYARIMYLYFKHRPDRLLRNPSYVHKRKLNGNEDAIEETNPNHLITNDSSTETMEQNSTLIDNTENTVEVETEAQPVHNDLGENSSGLIVIDQENNPMYERIQPAIPPEAEPLEFEPPSSELELPKYYTLPEGLILHEEVKQLYNKLFEEVPRTAENIPENIPQNINQLMMIFDRLKYFVRQFDLHKDIMESKRNFIENHVKKIGFTQKEVLDYYDLGIKYDEVLMRTPDASQIFVEKEAALKVHTEKIAEEIKNLMKEFELLRDYEDVIEEQLKVVRLAIENNDAVLISEKTDSANRIMHKLVVIRDGVTESLNQTKIGLVSLKENKAKLDAEVETLLSIAEGTYDPSAIEAHETDKEHEEPSGEKIMRTLFTLLMVGLAFIGL